MNWRLPYFFALAFCAMGCYPTRISPRIEIRLATVSGRPLADVEGNAYITPYPSLRELKTIPLLSDEKGWIVLREHYVWSDIFSRALCHLFNILMPHGFSNPGAHVSLYLPEDLKSAPRLNRKVTGNDLDPSPKPDYLSEKGWLMIGIEKPWLKRTESWEFIFEEQSAGIPSIP